MEYILIRICIYWNYFRSINSISIASAIHIILILLIILITILIRQNISILYSIFTNPNLLIKKYTIIFNFWQWLRYNKYTQFNLLLFVVAYKIWIRLKKKTLRILSWNLLELQPIYVAHNTIFILFRLLNYLIIKFINRVMRKIILFT